MTFQNSRTNHNTIISRNVVASLIIASAATFSLAVAPANAKTCKTYSHSGFATGVLSEAKSFAKKSWSNRVAQQEGPTWASWNMAIQKKISCVNGDTSLLQKNCTVTAVACRASLKRNKKIFRKQYGS